MDCIEPYPGLRIYFEPSFRGVVQINEHGEIVGKKQETKMTRAEAERKLAGSYNAGANILDALEALGLIKFDEESEVERIINNSRNTSAKNIIAMLELHNYRIVKE